MSKRLTADVNRLTRELEALKERVDALEQPSTLKKKIDKSWSEEKAKNASNA